MNTLQCLARGWGDGRQAEGLREEEGVGGGGGGYGVSSVCPVVGLINGV